MLEFIMKILVLEDNLTLADALQSILTEASYIVDVFSDGEEGQYALSNDNYDLLILDLGLPTIDGIDILTTLRKVHNDIPVLIISARDQLDQRVLGLHSGADDYLCKPFEFEEILARVEAILRRRNKKVQSVIKHNDLTFDLFTKALKKNNTIVNLSKRENDIFEFLLDNCNNIISKEKVAEYIASFDEEFNPKAVETYISRLRKKLGTSIDLKTIRGLGYILKKSSES